MAERKLAGKDLLFFVDPEGGTDYNLVVCLTSQSYERTKSTIDATTKCGPDTLNGVATRTISIEGVVLYGAEDGKVSEYALDTFWENDVKVGWKMAEVAPLTGSIVYQGTGTFSDLSTTYGQDGAATFSATLQVSGTPDKILVMDASADLEVDLGTIGATSIQVIGVDRSVGDFNPVGLTAVITVQLQSAPTVNVGGGSVTRTFADDASGDFITPAVISGLTTATVYNVKVTLNYGGTALTSVTTA